MFMSLPPNGGLMPKIADKLLPAGAAVIATNVDLHTGLIKPIHGLGPAVGTGGVSIYLDGDTWRSWDSDVDVVKSPVSQTRIIYTDGVMPKIRDGNLEYPLGIPAPTTAPSVTTQTLSDAGFTLEWHWFYEETTGVRDDSDASSLSVTATKVGQTYTLSSIPARITAPKNAQFILWCKVYDPNGYYIGQVIPSPSLAQEQSDAVVNGAILTGALVIASGVATFTFTWDLSNVTEFQRIREYVYTWVRTWPSDGATDEGPPSPVSSQVPIDPSQGCQLTNIPMPPDGYGITSVRIYRTVSGIRGTDFTYVGNIVLGTLQSDHLTNINLVTSGTTETLAALDSLADADIIDNGALQTTEYDPPPATLIGIRYHPSGFLVGFSGKYVYFSEPYQPHAWPSYSITCDYNIVGLGIVGQSVVVVTQGNPVLMTGNAPLSMSVTKVNNSQSGTAKRAIVETGSSVIYATPVGLVESPDGGLLTSQLYSKDQWQALMPSSMRLAWSDSKLFIFTVSGLKVIRVDGGAGPELTETPDIVDGHFVDLLTDTLYLSIQGNICPWGKGASRTYTYQTRTYLSPVPISPSTYRLTTDGETGVVVLSLYADGNLCYCETITSGDAQWLPVLPRAKQWSMKVMGTCTIRELIVADSMRLS